MVNGEKMKEAAIKIFREQVLDPSKGYFLIEGFLSSCEIDRYRQECEEFLKTGKRVCERPRNIKAFDCVHPRTVLSDGTEANLNEQSEKAMTYRIYQFLHNPHSKETEEIFSRSLTLRNAIEEPWLENHTYKNKKNSLEEYMQVTKYVIDSYGLPKHTDFRGELPFPLLQCLILLSKPEVDFLGGEFILYTKNNQKIMTHAELNMEKGDALFFDKSLYHEVERTQESPMSKIGRWSVIIGARYPRPPEQISRMRQTAFQIFKRIIGWLRR